MSINSNLLTREEAAEFLRVSYQTLCNWASTGKYSLPYLKIGGRVFYRKTDLDAWLETRERTQVEA